MNGLKLIPILAVGCVSVMGHIDNAAAAGCATAGILTSFQGNILVDRGDGFKAGAVGLSLKSGDKVSVVGPGSAVVDFGNSNVVTVPSSTTQTLRAPGCSSFLSTSKTGVVATVLVAGGVAAAITLANDRKHRSTRPLSP